MKFRVQQTILLGLSFLFLLVAADRADPVVHTELGSVRGKYVSVKGTEAEVSAFLGLPFAKPPVGPALRLAAPQPAEPWEGERDGTKQPLMCVQDREVVVELLKSIRWLMVELPDISEDCLYLNIYTPAKATPNSKLPVMVWIHGGGLAIGSASSYDGSALAAYEDVVVVLIQYRLGVLGFFSTGDEHIPGNFGMLDQVEALRWVQQHIHNFGGDPNSVTIFGESAGGVSVSLLLLSPLSRGLFHRAIAESGTAAMDSLVTLHPLPLAQIVANASGCSIEGIKEMSDCMRNADFDTFAALAQDRTLRTVVSVDGTFLMKAVDELFANHELIKVPLITGINDDEGGWILPNALNPSNWTEGIDMEVVLTTISMFRPQPQDEHSIKLVADEYQVSAEDRVRNRVAYTEIVGDLLFNIPALKTVNAHRDAGAPVYLYYYKYVPNFLREIRPSFVGCDHADELLAVFGFCLTTSQVHILDKCEEVDEQFSFTIMRYWANFARTGSPNGEGLFKWPQYSAEEHYLVIDKEQEVSQYLKKDRFIFFTETLPEKIREHEEKVEHVEL